MIGVNVAGIFVYDRRDQVHRKLFSVIRTGSSTSLRVQDERAKLVYFCIILGENWEIWSGGAGVQSRYTFSIMFKAQARTSKAVFIATNSTQLNWRLE